MFIGQACVIRIPNKSVIGIKELSSFDLDGVTRLLIRTDAWPDRTVFPVSIPYMDPQAIGYLSDKGIRLIGFDLPSVDPIESKTLLVHHQLSHADISILEGLVLDHIDAGDYEFIALPLSLSEADASPTRAVLKKLPKVKKGEQTKMTATNNTIEKLDETHLTNQPAEMRHSMTYGDYLYLDRLLSSQHQLSGHHDEMLFIIIHQASELWMKLMLHEINAVISYIQSNHLQKAFKILTRVSKIQEQLIQSWNVLVTLTPAEYMEFRNQLGQSSGFQSYQYRLIEFALGNKNTQKLAIFEHQSELYQQLAKAAHAPSLYDAAIQALAVAGLSIDSDMLDRDFSKKYQPNASVEQAWLTVYKQTEQYWELYELAEKLMDIASQHQFWQAKHMGTVERIIGSKVGTGGTSGVSYLKKVLEQNLFPELWNLRTKM